VSGRDPKTAARTFETKVNLGGYDAYCHVCWNPIHVLRRDDPRGECPFGAARAGDCETAMALTRMQADAAKMLRAMS
jgi:predicted DCC family thiol-disulfide oxidoreductase YuxK